MTENVTQKAKEVNTLLVNSTSNNLDGYKQ